ncbi:MAG: thiamine phosphate synthase [Propylenella sp.]
MSDAPEAPRLFLIAPPRLDAERFAPLLAEALAAGDVAAVLIASEARGKAAEAIAAKLVPIVQSAGAAAIVADDTRLAGHVRADGVQIGTGRDDLRLAVESFRPKRIVGSGNLASRHAAMEAGELEPDYLFFGSPHGDTYDRPHPKALDLAEWWCDLMQLPAVVMAGRSLDSVAEAAATGAAFVALHDAVWSHSGGPAEAVSQAETALGRSGKRAA